MGGSVSTAGAAVISGSCKLDYTRPMRGGWVVVVLLAACSSSPAAKPAPDAAKMQACAPGQILPDPATPRCRACAAPFATDGTLLDGAIVCLPTGQWAGKYRLLDACVCGNGGPQDAAGDDADLDATGDDGGPSDAADATPGAGDAPVE